MTDLDRPADWLSGRPAIVYQRCSACRHAWYLPRRTCASCGVVAPEALVASGTGIVHAVTSVSRAPSPEMREFAPYLLIFVDAPEGFRMMAHGTPGLRIGDAVVATFPMRAGRMMPLFAAPGDQNTMQTETK